MSDTDPDLQPREENNIVAADVVDGNLVLRRYNGTEEVVSLSSPSNETMVNVYLEANGVSDASSDYGLGVSANLYSSDGGTTLETWDDTDFVGGLEAGEDVIISDTGQLFFKKKGLFLGWLGILSGNVDGASVQVEQISQVAGSIKGGNVSVPGTGDVSHNPGGQILISVANDLDLSTVDDLSGLFVRFPVINKSGDPQDFGFNFQIIRL